MRVLDIGTGSSLRLANDFKREFIKADVVSFSPIFARKKFRKEAQEDNRPELLGMAVAGMGENLPFSDNSFDRILALHAFQYLNTQEGQDSFLNEIVRVLKKDGEAYIGPLFSGDKELLTPKLVKLRNTVRILHMLWSQNVAANTYKSKSRGPDSTAVNLMIRKAELKTIGLKPDIKTD
jgi:ubiquinone/menaquinone biosynthesis C-methylase UbiE